MFILEAIFIELYRPGWLVQSLALKGHKKINPVPLGSLYKGPDLTIKTTSKIRFGRAWLIIGYAKMGSIDQVGKVAELES